MRSAPLSGWRRRRFSRVPIRDALRQAERACYLSRLTSRAPDELSSMFARLDCLYIKALTKRSRSIHSTCISLLPAVNTFMHLEKWNGLWWSSEAVQETI